jgi:hypothetical protein
MSKNYYNISFPRMALLLLPILLRQNLIVAFVTSLVRPLTVIHSNFEAYMDSVNTRIDSQVCYMESLLNDTCDYYDRRIRIRDTAVNTDDFFLFNESTGNAVPVSDANNGDAVLWSDAGKLGTTIPDFEVVFPQGYALTDSEEKALRQTINNNKLASKKYRIVYE